jgi:hypothetical protein
MAIEFLRVTFPESRQVMANDVPVGKTNVPLRLPADYYAITLDGLPDYEPPSVDVLLSGTTSEKPRVVAFLPKQG